jgi:hypothetical protein
MKISNSHQSTRRSRAGASRRTHCGARRCMADRAYACAACARKPSLRRGADALGEVDRPHGGAGREHRRKSGDVRDGGPFVKPSDGLEPSTPSLPCGLGPLPWVADGCELACLSGYRSGAVCHRLPSVAPAWLHKRSTIVCSARRCLAFRFDDITMVLYNT